MAKNKNKRAKGPWVAYTPEDTVIYSIRTYPSMYVDKFLIYDHLFCVIGNGYDWKKGRLESVSGISIVPDIESSINAFKKSIKEDIANFSPELKSIGDLDELVRTCLDSYRESKDEEKKSGIELIRKSYTLAKASKPNFERIDKFMNEKFRNEKFMFYPLSEYSRICCLPDDIKPSWLKAAREFYEILFENQDRIENPEWLPKIEVRILELEAKRRRLEERREEAISYFYSLPCGKDKRWVIPSCKDDEHQCFQNTVKLSEKDIDNGFYHERVNPFYCNLYDDCTVFGLRTRDDGCLNMSFPPMERCRATSLCRELMRTIPKSGLVLQSFVDFFKEKGAIDWDIEGIDVDVNL